MALYLQGSIGSCDNCQQTARFVVIGNRNAQRAITWQVKFCKHCRKCGIAEQLNCEAIMDLFFSEHTRIVTRDMVEAMVERGELLQK